MNSLRTIVVVGGAGYIGSHMVRMLSGKGYRVRTVDDLSSRHRDAVTSGEFVVGNIGDTRLLDEVFHDYIHATDLCKAHLLALQWLEKGGGSERFNLGNSSGYSVKQVIDCAHGVISRDIAVIQGERRSGDPARPGAVSNKTRTVFGRQLQYSALDTSIAHAGCWESSARVGH